MFKVICVTQRRLCAEPFLLRVERLAAARPAALMLREKDLDDGEYEALARQVMAVCARHGTRCILHGHAAAAARLGAEALHLPLPALRQGGAPPGVCLGASCHSAADALEAQALGCAYVTAGHVFDTACKPGLPGRGLEFLRGVCAAVRIPVYAIGGMTPGSAAAARAAGAAGACVMGAAMARGDIERWIREMEESG